MKKLNFLYSLMAALMLSVAFVACSDDDDNSNGGNGTPDPVASYHYDLTVCTDKHGGMNRDKSHYTLSVGSLDDPNTEFDFKGQGAEITDYTMESIYQGQYMYQVPNANNRFSKLLFKNNKMTAVQEQVFKTNTYKSRNYTHAWLKDNTLLIISTDGEHKKVLWTKLNPVDMSIIDEGTLNINVAEGYNVLTTTGVAAYRKSDNKVFYFYYNKQETSGSSKTTNEPFFRIAVINPENMAVEREIVNKEASQCTASAYGELLQSTIFFDENDNLYISAFTGKAGQLLRIKNGEYDFEAGYNALPNAKGKLLTVQYMGNNKAFAYVGDGSGTSIDSFAYFYAVIDLNSKTWSRVQYNGADLPVSGGSFSQRSAVDTKKGKVYFGVDPENSQPQIYIYDIKTGQVSMGAKVAEGYYFEQIRIIED